MPRSQRRRLTGDKKLDEWAHGDYSGAIPRRRLRDATPLDRALIAFFIFVVCALLTGAVYWRMSLGPKKHEYKSATPLYYKTGQSARNHFLLVCFGGGVVSALGYVVLSLRDPYGTTGIARKEEEEARNKQDRFAFLADRDREKSTTEESIK